MPDTIQAQKDFYDRYWQGLKPLSSYKIQRTKWILDQLLHLRKRYSGVITLCDLGCGDGRLLPLWQAVTGAEAYGIELSPKAMEQAAIQYPGIHYESGDATATGYNAAMFDILICQEVLEHVEEQEVLIAEIARILKPEGALVLTTPNKFYFDRRKGGNYSQQPIEQIIDKKRLEDLLKKDFDVTTYTTLVYAKGDTGIYKRLTNRYWLGILRRAGLENSWKQYLLRKGYGLHMAVIAIRKP